MRGKILVKNQGGHKYQIKIRYLVVALALILSASGIKIEARAESCPDLRIVFARGSGGERWNTNDYFNYKNTIEEKLRTTDLNYEFIDLDYPAVGVGIDHLETTIGAYFGAGEAYEFGQSVKSGVKKLDKMVNGSACPGTKYVLGGYSQGAMVVSQALGSLNADRLIYAATFGDPKIYLPEGEGVIPAACRGENLSDYRMYVPDCQAYKGLLGAYIPYEPEAFEGKVGTWCNKRDIFCSSRLSMNDHLAYVADNLYEDASRVIFDKITKAYGIENHISSPHDTAILIDSTGSMARMIDQYKEEAYRLASETLNNGGRVALYDYRDLNDPYEPVQHCDFDTCTLEIFQAELDKIQAIHGGDTPESLLSASLHVMTDLEWKYGSTKSLVVLTDANFLSPDRDGVTFDEVVALSKRIDPVNFYIITNAYHGEDYEELAESTGGRVVTNFDELSLLTDYIMERYDALPRVEESEMAVELPTLRINKTELIGEDLVMTYTLGAEKAIVVLNDSILGMAEGEMVTISGLDTSVENVVMIVPVSGEWRGEGVSVKINQLMPFLPKVPNTGKN